MAEYIRLYSDDGSMTLALAASFIQSGGEYDHTQSIENYIGWYKRATSAQIGKLGILGGPQEKP